MKTHSNKPVTRDIKASAWWLALCLALLLGPSLTLAVQICGGGWSAGTISGAGNVNAIAGNGSRLVAVADGGKIFTLENGSDTWIGQTSPTTNQLLAVMWTGSQFVAGGSGVILTSANGITWPSDRRYSVSGSVDDIAWNGSTYVAIGPSTILTSTDGTSWTYTSSGESIQGITWTGDRFVIVCYGGNIYTNTNGDPSKWALNTHQV